MNTYDPIMEVSLLMDDEEEEENDLINLPNTGTQRSSDEDKPNIVNEEANSYDEKRDDVGELDHSDTLASKLLNRETCV